MKHARLRTDSADGEIVAAALEPDNTAEMSTTVEGDTIETTLERERTGGLRSTVDDYVVNLSVAERIVRIANDYDTQHNDTA
jgi:hypothetical protein